MRVAVCNCLAKPLVRPSHCYVDGLFRFRCRDHKINCLHSTCHSLNGLAGAVLKESEKKGKIHDKYITRTLSHLRDIVSRPVVEEQQQQQGIDFIRDRSGIIRTWEELDFESDVATLDGKERTVDADENRQNWKIWQELLNFRRRVYGFEGIKTIWKGMKIRHIDLPTRGEYARAIWASLTTKDTVLELWKHALDQKERTGTTFPELYELLMTCNLESSQCQIIRLHKWFIHKDYPVPDDALAKLAPIALKSDLALKPFKQLYLYSKSRNLYDVLVPELRAQRRYEEAVQWHLLLTKHHDLPSARSFTNGLDVKDLVSLSSDIVGQPHVHLATRRSAMSTCERPEATILDCPSVPELSNTRQTFRPFSREVLNRILGITHGVYAKPFDDGLCARILATSAFSIDFAIGVISVMGVDQIGPTTLRELAIRGSDPQGVLDNLRKLKTANITILDCVFSRLVERLAQERRFALLTSVLNSDQHPDVYEDPALLRSILASYVRNREWMEVRRILIVLTAFHKDPSSLSWNLLLQAYIHNSWLEQTAQVLEDIQTNKVPLSAHSLYVMGTGLLRERKPGHMPVPCFRGNFDEMAFITNAWRLALESGFMLKPSRWRELIKRYGMLNRFNDLSRLCLWLVEWYSPNKAAATRIRFTSIFSAKNQFGFDTDKEYPNDNVIPVPRLLQASSDHPLNQIFSPHLQRAFVAWGFKTNRRKKNIRRLGEMPGFDDKVDDMLKLESLRGLYLLRQLRKQGVLVQTSALRKEIKLRLVILFGPYFSNRRSNRLDNALNPHSIEKLVVAVEQAWGWTMFGLSDDLKMRLLQSVFGEKDITTNIPGKRINHSSLAVKTELLRQIYGSQIILRSTNTTINTKMWAKWLQTKEHDLGNTKKWDRKSRGFRYIKPGTQWRFRKRLS